MYSYTAATLAIRAKCSLSSYCLFLPNDRSYCCHRSCCHSCSHFLSTGLFPASPRILSGYLLGQSALIPSGTFFLSGRRRLRVSCRSRDLDVGLSEMMGLLAEQEEIFPGEDRNRKEVHLRDLSWKKGRREIEIRLVDEDCWSSRREAKTGRSSSRRRERLSSSVFSTSSLLRGSELNEAVSRRTGGKSISGYGNAMEGSKFDAVDIAEKDVREVHEYVDDSWRERKDSYKRDVVMDSRKDESLEANASFRWPTVKDGPQQASSREKESVRGTQMVTRTSEVQRDDVKRTSVSSKVRKVERGESSTSAARQDSDVNHRVAQHAELRRSSARECKVPGFHYSDVMRAAYPGKDFKERRTRGREETCMEQHIQQVIGDKKIHPDWQAVEEDESRRSTQRLSEVSVFQDNDFERASYIDNERVKGMDVSSTLIQDSIQVSRNKRAEMELQMYEENRVNERKGDSIERNLNQSRIGKINQFNRRAAEHDESRRNTQMLSEVSEIHGGNVEATSHVRGKRVTGMEFSSDSYQSSVRATKDIGTQVGMNNAYEDQIGMSRLNANNIVNATSSQSPPASRFDPQEYSAVLALNQVSSLIEQPSLAKHDYVQYSARAESESATKEFDLTRGIKKSGIQETFNSRIEDKKETSSEENSSVILSQERKESQISHLTGESRQSTSMHLASSGSLRGISSSLSNEGEVDNQAGRVDIHQIRYETIESAKRLDKSSALHVGQFVDKLQKELVSLNDPGNTSNASSGINIDEQGMSNSQTALRLQNQKEISSAGTSSIVLNQERKENHNILIIGGSSETTPRKMASTGSAGVVPSSLQTNIEVGNCSRGDDIHQFDNDTIESARQLDKSSAQHVGEFVKNLQQEIMNLDKSGKEPNVSIGIQIEETGRRETQVTTDIEADELNESRSYRDERYAKESRRLSSSGLGVKGLSDEMWDVQVLFSKEPSISEVPDEGSSTGGAIGITSTTPTSESAISRRPHKSLWSYVADVIRMSWVLRGQTRSLTLKSDKRASSNESTSSEAWFSGPEPDEDGAEDERQDKERSGLTKKSAPMQEPIKLAFEDSKFRDRLTARESNSSISSGFTKRGLSARIASSSAEAEQTEDAKPSQETLSSLAVVQQQRASKADAASPSITNVVESRVGNRVEVLKPSSSYSAGMKKVGFSSRITEDTDIPQIEAAQVRDNNISGFEILEQPSVSTADSVIPRISDTEAVDMPFNEIPKLQLDPFREKLPEVGGTKAAEMKQRKLHRNKQVLSEQFDEWEEAFKRETEQKKLDVFFMREAILEAKKGADTWEVPVGAVLVQNGKIIARSCNMVEEMRDSTAHAEMICIREASNLLQTWRLAETTLYVTLEPCPMCAGAILQARIDTVVWGAPNRLLGADGSWVRLFPGGDGVSSSSLVPPSQMVGPIHPFHPKITIRRGVLATECGDVMQQFFKLRRKKDKKPEPSPPSCLPISNRHAKFFTKLHNIFCIMFCL